MPADRDSDSRARARASCFIALCLLAQLVAGFRLLCLPEILAGGPACPGDSPRLWPFLDYGMFRGAYRPGDRLTRAIVVVTDAGGAERRLEPWDERLQPAPREAVLHLRAGDRPALARWIAAYEASTGTMLEHLRLEETELVLTRDGPLELAPRVTRALLAEPRR